MKDDQNKNLILAVALSMLVIIGWSVLFPPPETPKPAPGTETSAPQAAQSDTGTPVADATTGTAPAITPPASSTTADEAVAALKAAPRIAIDTPKLKGALSLLGGRIDELSLDKYKETLAEDAPDFSLLKPQTDQHAYFAVFGWAPGNGLTADAVPGPQTLWTTQDTAPLTPDHPVTMEWDNGNGLTFNRTISVDDEYMFNITQSVTNSSSNPVSLAPYGIITRHGLPEGMLNRYIVHEGLVGMHDGELTEVKYKKMKDFEVDPGEGTQADVVRVTKDGWIGFTDHYWMTTLIPPTGPFKSVAKYDEARDIYQTEAVQGTRTLAPGASTQAQTRLFAGAKEWATIHDYQENQGVVNFVDSIDWGWFFFITKPMFRVLHWLHGVIGNMGWAIIALTVVIKALVFPLAYKSYASMAKMRELQPQMEKLKEQVGDDRQKLQQEMMALYKREKVNPASGCLPILIQIPIFFSLYKVIYVTIELYHAPWIGWIHDLSAPDPSSILNLFGLLPFAPPDPTSFFALFSLGVLPILLGISMWLQQKLNPAPTDATQKMIFAWMPWVFMFMLGSFASGLVLYWIANNTITFLQQYSIMRIHGYKPDVFGNIRTSFARAKGGGNTGGKA
ncbi:membrane protein insertase YidC [Aquicoccus sp. G2-2]|uniref:membrane protein insertase YidC n=1 Tax=Aquicoccus sp. G2-2 TaxID=3092120 RepID=UPI002ADF2A6E|nr:membrane protein insertase YidC [Aquicoccus sp. G2-2]MEA1113819.1 membrane protein insertase YidC [Aquicoccus sp. G2-2]